MKKHLAFTTAAVAACGLLLICSTGAEAKKRRAHSESKPQGEAPAHPSELDAMIAEQARIYGIPESLVHRIVMRESKYRPEALNRIYFGLMQITYATARSMGYQGPPKGLLDAMTNLTYAVPYLANAYIVADKDPDRAITLYSSGYYFEARRKHQLALLRTASSKPAVEETVVAQAAPEPPSNPVARLFAALAGPAQTAEPNPASNPPPAAFLSYASAAEASAPPPSSPAASEAANPSTASEAVPAQTADASEDMEPVWANAPLPPRRPKL